ncbi:hypothetical protein D3C76_385530 [compost metagenome]
MGIRPAQPADLRVGVGEQPALQQRVVGEVDARHDMPRAEGYLLGFGKEVVRVAIEHHLAQQRHRHQLFGDDLGRVEQVKVILVFVSLGDDLHAQFPFRIVAGLDGLPKVAAVVVGVLARQLLRLIPQQRMHTLARLPVELDETGHALGVDQAEGVHAKALHHPQAARDGTVGHGPGHHVRRLRHQRDEVPESVVSRAAGRHLVVRLGFDRMYEVRKLDGVLDEKHRHVVANQVEIAFIGIELDGKAAHVAYRVTRASRPLHRGKTHEYRGHLLRGLQETGLGQLGMAAVALEVAMRPGPTGMDDTLRNALMVEVGDLLAHDEVFEQRRPASAGLETVLVVGDLHALVGAQGLACGIAAEGFQALELGIGVGPIGGLGAGGLAVLRRVRVLAGHGRLSSSVFRRTRFGLVQVVTGRLCRAFNQDYRLSRYARRIGALRNKC